MNVMSAIPRIVGDLQRTVQELRSENSELKAEVASLLIENAALNQAAASRSEVLSSAQGDSGSLKRAWPFADYAQPAKQTAPNSHLPTAQPSPPKSPSLEQIVPDKRRRLILSVPAGATLQQLLAYLQRKRFEVHSLDMSWLPSSKFVCLRDVIGAFKSVQHLRVTRPFYGKFGTLTDDVFSMCSDFGISQLKVDALHKKLTGPGLTGFLLVGASTGRKRTLDIAALHSLTESFILDFLKATESCVHDDELDAVIRTIPAGDRRPMIYYSKARRVRRFGLYSDIFEYRGSGNISVFIHRHDGVITIFRHKEPKDVECLCGQSLLDKTLDDSDASSGEFGSDEDSDEFDVDSESGALDAHPNEFDADFKLGLEDELDED